MSFVFSCLGGGHFFLSCCLIALLLLFGFNPTFSLSICGFDLRKNATILWSRTYDGREGPSLIYRYTHVIFFVKKRRQFFLQNIVRHFFSKILPFAFNCYAALRNESCFRVFQRVLSLDNFTSYMSNFRLRSVNVYILNFYLAPNPSGLLLSVTLYFM